jgi:hypothetical protein
MPGGLLIAVGVLTLASVVVVFESAADEPYLEFRAGDCFVQIGVACILILLWAELGAWIVWRAWRRALALPWLALLAWAAIHVFYLTESARGYAEDITKFTVSRGPSAAP